MRQTDNLAKVRVTMYNYDDDAPVNQYPTDSIPDAMGYWFIAITDDGDTLCERCVADPSNPVHKASPNDRYPDGWGVVGWTHTGEVESYTVCAHCNRTLVPMWVYHDKDTGMEYWHDGDQCPPIDDPRWYRPIEGQS